MKVVGLTDIGLKRKRNEDGYLIDNNKNLFVVCDGMGGHKGGNVASKLALDVIHASFAPEQPEKIPEALSNSIQAANEAIWERSHKDINLHDMGTTVTAAVCYGNQLFVAHVGDSSLYLIRNHSIRKVTVDHTIAQQMLNNGLIQEKDKRNNPYNHILTRALGADRPVFIDFYSEKIQEKDCIILCTDGLTDLVDDQEILQTITNEQNIEAAARALIDTALKKGGHDNITVILLLVELGGK
ncbi:MAG TPA: Stp1/IreP family PP2C-type Ser/Thr phosphatase [Syntrophomonadaceae bacterium]|nr:Stp1/IreP family PP2C-type Ser/Thr phosphatase [Syntrophomonadaceae bacterium]